MKLPLAKVNALLIIVCLAVLAISCGVRTLPMETTAAPTGTPIPDIVTSLPEFGGEAAGKVPAVETLPPPAATDLPPASVAPGPPCDSPVVCSRLLITQAGKVSQMEWSANGVVPLESPSILPQEQSSNSRWMIDTGMPSPDGKWVAFTSLSYESGGPVFLQQLESGAWTNLIETVNIMLPEGRQRLAEDYLWDVIGWFPDSQRLMIGPYDLSFVAIVELSSFSVRVIPFPGGGKGGRPHVNLAADGSHFVYVGEDASGAQTLNAYNLANGDSTVLRVLPYDQGILSIPRLSPDGKSLAYLRLQNNPSSGSSGELAVMSLETGAVTTLAQGSLWMAVPVWAPDGRSLAFTLVEQDNAALAAKGAVQSTVRGNVWVVSVADGALTQITFVDGFARSPAWSADGKTLAFVTHDGQVGLASVDEPGKVWQAAGPSPATPELTSVYFVP